MTSQRLAIRPNRLLKTRKLLSSPQARIGACIVAASPVLLAMLRIFPPERFSLYPVCPIHRYTGLLCPGCGGTRALAALLRGDLAGAWHHNALSVTLLPFVLLYALAACGRLWRGETEPWPRLPTPAVYVLGAAAAVFTIARNLV